MIPDNIETIIMTKKDYDRNIEQLLLEKIDLQQKIDKAIKYIEGQKPWWEEWHYDGSDIDIEHDINTVIRILKGSEE